MSPHASSGHRAGLALILLALGGTAQAQIAGADGSSDTMEGWAPAQGDPLDDAAAIARTTPGPAPIPGLGLAEPPVRLGGFFGFPFGAPQPLPNPEPGRMVTLRGGITGQVRATDNLFPGQEEKRADVVTSLTPDMLLTLDTARLQGRIFYAPTLHAYASETDQNRIDHRLNASLTATLIPGSLFLDMRGHAAVTAISGGFAGVDETSLPRRDRAQSAAFTATPYYIHRFGGLATAMMGYTLQYSRQSGTARALTPGGLPYYSPQEFTSHTGFAAIRSGEDFGRLALEARVSGTSYTGDGVLDGAHRAIGSVEARYAITREVSLLAEIGYEDQAYNGVPRREISEPIWAIGARFDPSPDTTIIVRYQRRDGFNSPSASARVAIGPRTTFFGSYSDHLTTTTRRVADLLTTTSVDPLGNPIDTATGAPSISGISGSLLAQQNALLRVKLGTASISQAWDRDTVTLSYAHEERIPVAVARNSVAFQQESDSLTLAWSHSLTPQTTLIGSVQYGRFESSTLRDSGNSYLVRATAIHRFTEKLTGSLQYQVGDRFTDLADRDSPRFGQGDRLQHAVIATLRYSF